MKQNQLKRVQRSLYGREGHAVVCPYRESGLRCLRDVSGQTWPHWERTFQVEAKHLQRPPGVKSWCFLGTAEG